MTFIRKYSLINLFIMVVLSFLANYIAVEGAKKGGSDISFRSTQKARLRVGVSIILLGAVVSSPDKKS